jgi:hypothetical protein
MFGRLIVREANQLVRGQIATKRRSGHGFAHGIASGSGEFDLWLWPSVENVSGYDFGLLHTVKWPPRRSLRAGIE